ncbi:hypothetical protein PSCICE_34680 [Pseudomonas cichorii]|nr:hypothetical protein PSCICE_34680 [Pseudomonas cichorii]
MSSSQRTAATIGGQVRRPMLRQSLAYCGENHLMGIKMTPNQLKAEFQRMGWTGNVHLKHPLHAG